MARKNRNGERKKRDSRLNTRIPEMGYYLVITDTKETEKNYFTGLHDEMPENLKSKLVVKVVKAETQNMIRKCLDMTAYEPQFRERWIVFDRDQVVNFDEIIDEAKKADIKVGWSNPCFEIWLYSYFGEMPSIQESWTCCERFSQIYKSKTGKEYSKSASDLYRQLSLNGDEGKAIQIAEAKRKQCCDSGYTRPSEMCPCTTVHELVGKIRKKIGGM